MGSDVIKQIWIEPDGRICVKPEWMSFENIYRSAKGVVWNSSKGFLQPSPYWRRRSGSQAPEDWFEKILAAVRYEYRCELLITSNTEWINIDKETRKKIEAKN